jgi:hypothetical protein
LRISGFDAILLKARDVMKRSFIEKHSVLVISVMALLCGILPLLGLVFIPMLLFASKKG